MSYWSRFVLYSFNWYVFVFLLSVLLCDYTSIIVVLFLCLISLLFSNIILKNFLKNGVEERVARSMVHSRWFDIIDVFEFFVNYMIVMSVLGYRCYFCKNSHEELIIVYTKRKNVKNLLSAGMKKVSDNIYILDGE